MDNVLKSLLLSGEPRKTWVRIGGNTIPNEEQFLVTGSTSLLQKLNSSPDINFGECNAGQFDVEIFNIADVTGQNIHVYQTVQGYEGEIPLFTGTVFSCKLQSDKKTRHLVAYDELYMHLNDNVSEWYEGLFTGTPKTEYKGDWNAAGKYKDEMIVKYDGAFYQYICKDTDTFTEVTYKDVETEDGIETQEVITTYNVVDFCVGKTPTQILDDYNVSSFVIQLTVYNPYNYSSITVGQFRKSLMAHVGIPYDNTQVLMHDGLSFSKTLNTNELTFQACLQCIGQINAVFGHINESGVFSFVSLGGDEVDYTGNFANSMSMFEENPIDIASGVAIYGASGEVIAISGSPGNQWAIQNNFLLYDISDAQAYAITEALFAKIKTLKYTPANLTPQLSLPVKMGDTIKVEDSDGDIYKFYVLDNSMGGQQMTEQIIICNGSKTRSSESLNAAISNLANKTEYLAEKIYQKLTADMIETKQITAKLGVFEGVSTKRLDAEYARINKLEAKSITTDSITAEIAKINVAEIKQASIEEGTFGKLVGDVLVASDITAENGRFHHLDTDSLDAKYIETENLTTEVAKIKVAEIEQASIEEGTFGKLVGDVLVAEDITADNGKFHYLDTNTLQAQFIKANLTEADKAVITDAIVEKMLAGNIVTGSQTVTGEFTGITIDASAIKTGVLDAAQITVKNINADNITVHYINGQSVTVNEAINNFEMTIANLEGQGTNLIRNAETLNYSAYGFSGDAYTDENGVIFLDENEATLVQ